MPDDNTETEQPSTPAQSLTTTHGPKTSLSDWIAARDAIAASFSKVMGTTEAFQRIANSVAGAMSVPITPALSAEAIARIESNQMALWKAVANLGTMDAAAKSVASISSISLPAINPIYNASTQLYGAISPKRNARAPRFPDPEQYAPGSALEQPSSDDMSTALPSAQITIEMPFLVVDSLTLAYLRRDYALYPDDRTKLAEGSTCFRINGAVPGFWKDEQYRHKVQPIIFLTTGPRDTTVIDFDRMVGAGPEAEAELESFISRYLAYLYSFVHPAKDKATPEATAPSADTTSNKQKPIPPHPERERRELVRELKLKGYSDNQIKEAIHAHAPSEWTVRNDLKWLRKRGYMPADT